MRDVDISPTVKFLVQETLENGLDVGDVPFHGVHAGCRAYYEGQ